MQVASIDIINSIVGGLALIASSVTVYFQFFKKVEDLHMSLLGLRYSSRASQKNAITAELVFVNGGDVSATVTDLALVMPNPVPGTGWGVMLHVSGVCDGGGVNPLPIQPGEVVHRRAVFTYDSSLFEDESANTQGGSRATVLRAWVIGQRGVRYSVDLEGLGLQWRNGMISGVEAPQQARIRLLPRPRGERPGPGPNEPPGRAKAAPGTIRVRVEDG